MHGDNGSEFIAKEFKRIVNGWDQGTVMMVNGRARNPRCQGKVAAESAAASAGTGVIVANLKCYCNHGCYNDIRCHCHMKIEEGTICQYKETQ